MIQKGKRYFRKGRTGEFDIDKVVEIRHIDTKWVEVVDDKYSARTRIPKERFLEFFEPLNDKISQKDGRRDEEHRAF